MHDVERLIHDCIGEFDWLRKSVVLAYQALCSPFPAPVRRPGHPLDVYPGLFFGFHDRSPWSVDDKYLLAHRFDSSIDRPGTEGAAIEVGIIPDHGEGGFRPMATTQTWTWQLGASSFWVGASHCFGFNALEGDRPVTKLLDINGAPVGLLPVHTAAISPTGDIAVSFDFGRIAVAASEYGYRLNSPNSYPDLPDEVGIKVVNVRMGTVTSLLGYQEVARASWESSMKEAFHFFSHALFAPDGTRFAFFHRWRRRGRSVRTRLWTSDLHGRSLRLLPFDDASHIAWLGNDRMVVYGKAATGRMGLWICNEKSGALQPTAQKVVRSDGHPQVAPDGRYIVIDTYPDRSRVQRLYLLDLDTEKADLLLAIRSPFRFRGAFRCDFHPRWNRRGSAICFDAVHEGQRSLCILRLRDDDAAKACPA